jgi:hypothetical protein
MAIFSLCLIESLNIFQMKVELSDQALLFGDAAAEIRWFLLPSEAQLWISKPNHARQRPTHPLPFHPGSPVEHTSRIYKSRKGQICLGRDKISLVPPGEQIEKKADDIASGDEPQNVVGHSALAVSDQSGDQIECSQSIHDSAEHFKDELCDYLTEGFVGSDEGDLDLELTSAVSSTKCTGDLGSCQSTGIKTAPSEFEMVNVGGQDSRTTRQTDCKVTTKGMSESESLGGSECRNSSPESVENSSSSNMEEALIAITSEENCASEAEDSRRNLQSEPQKVHLDSDGAKVDESSRSVACLACVPKKQSDTTCKDINKVLTWHPPPKVIFNPTLEVCITG